MQKSEIISLVLEHLANIFNQNPDAFVYFSDESEYTTNGAEYVAWQSTMASDNYGVFDPNNVNRSILVKFSRHRGTMSLFLFSRGFSTIKELEGSKVDSSLEIKRFLIKLRSPYKKFKKLKKLISDRDKKKENEAFMRRLTSVFPSLLDDEIFGRDD